MTIPTTISTLLFVVLFITPGLLFEQGIERHLTYWRTNFQNRFVRFSMWSFIWTPILSPAIFAIWKWHSHLTSKTDSDPGILFVFVCVASYTAAFIALPFLLGRALGQDANKTEPSKWVEWILGLDLAPRTWDQYFRPRSTQAWVRIRFKETHEWIAGNWVYASSYPEPEDIALNLIQCDAKTGEIGFDEIDGIFEPIPLNWKMIVRREDIDLVAWQPTEIENEEENVK